MKKIISILMVIIMICLIFNVNFVLAGGSESQITDITSIVNKMEPSNDMSNTNNRFGNILNIIIGLFQVVGTGIAVIAVAILGMKYMAIRADKISLLYNILEQIANNDDVESLMDIVKISLSDLFEITEMNLMYFDTLFQVLLLVFPQ